MSTTSEHDPHEPLPQPLLDLAQAQDLDHSLRATTGKIMRHDRDFVACGRFLVKMDEGRGYRALGFKSLSDYCAQLPIFATYENPQSLQSTLSKYRSIGANLTLHDVRSTRLCFTGLYAVSRLPAPLRKIALRYGARPRDGVNLTKICPQARRMAKEESLADAAAFLKQALQIGDEDDDEETEEQRDAPAKDRRSRPTPQQLLQRLPKQLKRQGANLRRFTRQIGDGELDVDELRDELRGEVDKLCEAGEALLDALRPPAPHAASADEAEDDDDDDDGDDNDADGDGDDADGDDGAPDPGGRRATERGAADDGGGSDGDEDPRAARPYTDPASETALAVPALRGDDFDVTIAERHLCRLIVLAHRARGLAGAVVDLRVLKCSDSTPVRLRRDIHDRLDPAINACDDLRDRFTDVAGGYQGEPPLTLDPGRAAACALDWVVYSRADPYGAESYAATEPPLWELHGLLPVFQREVEALLRARGAGGEQGLIEEALMAQACAVFQDLADRGAHLVADFFPAVEAAAAEERRATPAADPRCGPSRIVMGADVLPRCYGVVARTADGRTVVAPTDEATAELYIGGRGSGKSHHCRVHAENLVLTPPGLCCAPAGAQRAALFETDVRRSQSRYELFQCFFANHKPEDRRRLQAEYGVSPPPLALQHGKALVHPHEVLRVRRETAVYRERGLDVQPLLVGPADLTGYALEVTLSSLLGGVHGARQPMYLGFAKTVAARFGDRLTLRLLRTAVEESDLDGRSKGVLMAALDQLQPLWSESGSILGHLQEPGMLFVLLRSRHLSPDFVLPLQAVLFNALSRTPPGWEDRLRWFFIDELAKMLKNPVFAAYLLELLQELRHNSVSFSGCVQHLMNLPVGMLAQFSSVYLYRNLDPAVLRRIKAETGAFHGVTQAQVAGLGPGECFGWTQRSNDARAKEVLRLRTRPTCMRAGGESMIIGGGGGRG